MTVQRILWHAKTDTKTINFHLGLKKNEEKQRKMPKILSKEKAYISVLFPRKSKLKDFA